MIAPVGYDIQDLGHNVVNPVTRGIWRVSRGSEVAVIKALQLAPAPGPSGIEASADPHHWNYWRREALAYGSGLLDELPAGLRAPRCLKIEERGPEEVWLWLEEVSGEPGAAWELARYRHFGKQLGRWQGPFLAGRPLPEAPWLSTGWLSAFAPEPSPEALALLDRAPAGLVPPVDQLQALVEARPHLIAALAAMPQTLGHFDAWPPNLFGRGDETILLDWAYLGRGAPAEDAANLVFDGAWSLIGRAADVLAVEDAVLGGYIEGLGPDVDPAMVRTAYAAVCGARFGLWAPALIRLALEPERHAALEARHGLGIDQILARRSALVAHAVRLGLEAIERIG